MRAPVVLHSISSFDQDTLENSAIPIVKGLLRCINSTGPLRSEITKSPDFWSILQRLHRHQEGAGMVFDLLQNMVAFTPPVITADNYESGVSLANDFASAGSVGVVQEPKRDSRRSKVARQPKIQ